MFNLDNRFYRFLNKIVDFLLLNFLWFLFCLPVITIFPATAAMFGVVRSWLRKEEPSTTKMFITLFKDNVKHGLILGVVWTLLGSLFMFNVVVGFQMDGSIKMVLMPFLLIIIILYFYTSIFIFPIMVNYQLNWLEVIKNSFLFSLGHPLTSLLGIFILTVVIMLTFIIPISFLVLSSTAAYFIYYFCGKSFNKVEMNKNLTLGVNQHIKA